MPTIELLAKKLQSRDSEARREAAVDLGLAGKEGVPLLLHALGDTDWRVRKTAVEALVSMAGEGILRDLIQALSSHDNAGARNSAIEALILIGSAAVNPLLSSLDTPDSDVCKFIVDILGDIRDRRAVPSLIHRLDDPDENIRVAAAEALGKIKDRRAVDALLTCLGRSDRGWLDYAAAEALGEIGDERALEALIAALGRSSLREPVLESLGKIGNVKTVGPLISGLSDPLRIVREVSTIAITAIYRKSTPLERAELVQKVRGEAGPETINFVEEMLTTSGIGLQKACIMLLGWTGEESSIRKLLSLLKEEDMEEPVVLALNTLSREMLPVLLDYLKDDNALLRRAVARVLGATQGADAEGPLMQLLQDENGHVRSTAAEALGRQKSTKAIPSLLELLTDEYENVQEAAIRALAAIGDESVLDPLLKDFTSRDVPMRKNIALLLGSFSSGKAGDALAFALKDEESDVRKAVVHALGNFPPEKAHRPLMLAVTDDDPEVRMLAAEALGKAGTGGAADALISLLQDRDLWVRAAAARGLGRLNAERAGAVLAQHLDTASDIFLLAVIEVIGLLKPEQALEPLLKLSEHADSEVRKTVLTAVASYSWEKVRDSVIARLSDSHWSVRKAAIEIARRKRDAKAESLFERIADNDPDGAVRQAAKEALGK